AVGLLRLVGLAVVEREAVSDDAAMREQAFLALRRRTAESERVLERLTRSTRRATAMRASGDLFERGSGGDRATLWAALGSTEPEERVAGVAVLRDLDGPSVER